MKIRAMKKEMRNRGGDARGFTLVEILIVLGLFSLVIGSIYNIYIGSMRNTESQRLTGEMEQNARASLDYMARELSQMGYKLSECGSGSDVPITRPPAGAIAIGIDNDKGPQLVYADKSEIAFAYYDTASDKYRLVWYWLDDVTDPDNIAIKRSTWLWDVATTTWSAGIEVKTLVDSVLTGGLEFNYYNSSGTDITPIAGVILNDAERSSVRRVGLTVTTEQSKDDPNLAAAGAADRKKEYSISTEVATRNLLACVDGDGSGVYDDGVAPPVPTITSVTPTGECGNIRVEWSASSATDLKEYIIEVTNPGGFVSSYPIRPEFTTADIGGLTTTTERINVGEGTEDFSLYSYRIPHGEISSVSMYAKDDFGNMSSDSNTMTVTPTASVPTAPTIYSAVADIDEGLSVTITLSDPGDDDVGGYRVYRSDYLANNFVELANEDTGGNAWDGGPSWSTLASLEYIDSSIGDTGRCAIYEYKFKAISYCLEMAGASSASAYSSATYGDAGFSGGITDTPSDGITNTRPADTTSPADPVINVLKAGYRKDLIGWDNPSDADLATIVIRYNDVCGIDLGLTAPTSKSDGIPIEDGVSDANGTASGGNMTGAYADPAALGRSFVHLGDPAHLTASLGAECPNIASPDYIATYSYSVFAVDQCGLSSGSSSSVITTVEQCGETTPGDAVADPTLACQVGAPTWSDSACSGAAGGEDGLVLSDTCGVAYDLAWNGIDGADTKVWDIAGFYMYSRQSVVSWTPVSGDFGDVGITKSTILPNLEPTTSYSVLSGARNPDDNTLYMGNSYQYYVIPLDCNREATSGNPWAVVAAAPSPTPEASKVLTVTPGRATFTDPSTALGSYPMPSDRYATTGEIDMVTDPAVPTSATSFYHNRVEGYIYNTSAGDVSLDSFVVSWSNSNAYLSQVDRLDTGNCLWGAGGGCDVSGQSPTATGVTISPGSSALNLL